MALDKVLYTAHATSTGGRAGSSKSSDGNLAVTLTTPKELGGDGAPGTNPEQLFAAGYSACFLGAMKHVAMMQKITLPAATSITADVGIGPIPAGFGIQVAMAITHPRHGARCRREAGADRPRRVPLLERHPRQHHAGRAATISAAFVGQVSDERCHRQIVSTTDKCRRLALLRDKSGVHQLAHVMGKR